MMPLSMERNRTMKCSLMTVNVRVVTRLVLLRSGQSNVALAENLENLYPSL